MSDDEELDAELLALAGGESSSDEEEDIKIPSPKRKTDSRNRAPSEERSPPRRSAGTKLKSRAKARRSRRADDSDEEGEA